MSLLRTLLVLAAVFVTFAPSRADALLCHAILGCSCNVTVTDMNFGNIQPLLSTPTTADSDVHVDCTGILDAVPLVSAKIGPGSYGTYANRQMRTAGGQQLTYNVYYNGQILGEGVGYPMLVISGGLLALGHWSTTVSMHGIVPPTPTARPGVYSDTIVVRIDW